MANQSQSKNKHDASTEDNANKQTTSKNETEAKSDTSDLVQKLDSLKSTLEADLSDLEADAALELVSEWQGLLQKVKEPEVKEINTHLKELAKLLKSNKATGHEIGEVLMEIGEQTANFAGDADKEIKTPVRQLGKQLSKIGNSLGKAEDQEQIEEIDALTETLEDDLTQVESETSIGAIDSWYGILHKSDDEHLKEIANGLKELKQLLKRSNPKPGDIAEVLTHLGEQTQQVASEAKRGFKGPIQRLGKMLTKSGKSLEE